MVRKYNIEDPSTKSTKEMTSENGIDTDPKMNDKHTNGNSNKQKYSQTGVDSLSNVECTIPGKENGQEENENTVSVLKLYRYSDKIDKILIVIGTIGAMLTGVATPLGLVIYDELIELFVGVARSTSASDLVGNVTQTATVSLVDLVGFYAMFFSLIALATFICSYIAISCWSWTAERQTNVIRKEYFRAIMRQEIGWFDTHVTGELNARLASDLHTITECMGDKVAICVQFVATSIGCYTMALALYWKLALVCLAFSPFLFCMTYMIGQKLRKMSALESQAYAEAGAVADEALRIIRTVQAFQGQEKEAVRFETHLNTIDALAAKKGITFGLVMATFWSILFISFSITAWYGLKLYQDENLSVGTILPVFLGSMVGTIALGNAFPYIETFTQGKGAAESIFKVIDAVPYIDVSSDKGEKPVVKGNIEFTGVDFTYPSRPDAQVLKDMTLSVDTGKVVALVGSSGSGKSTVIQLVQRFYDPINGQVLVDGRDIRMFNVKYLREQIGVVSQEPVLFATSIEENIRYGSLDATKEEIIQAASQANAHNFITQLPQGYETLVGERGSQLSGGQKQRIAIARALVRNPKILLLDEATSALDHESEAIVQGALENAQAGRTTIVIAHRLSTVKNADSIAVVDDGIIKELGTHDSLMEKQELYYHLVQAQMKASEKHHDAIDNDEDESDVEDEIPRPGSPLKPLKSVDSTITKDKEDTEVVESEVKPASLKRIIKFNSPEWMYLLLGGIASIFLGTNHAAFAFVFSEYIRIFAIQDRQEQMETSILISSIFAGYAVFSFFVRLVQNFCLSVAGARLTSRFRKTVFRSYLKQDMEFFDSSNNEIGVLTTKLASDSNMIRGATGSNIGSVLENLTLLCVILGLAFYYGWKLSLVIIAFIPLLIGSGIIRGRMSTGFNKADSSNLDMAGKVCSEAVDNIRVVAALTREDIFLQKYEDLINKVKRDARKKAFVYAIFYALAQSMLNLAYAATFSYGAVLVEDGEMEFYAVFRVSAVLVFGSMVIGRQSAYTMDYSKAKVAAGRLFSIIERTPKIDSTDSAGTTLESFTGELEIRNIKFNYPSRPGAPVLDGFNLNIKPGETVALVGHSGCGKSTVVQLVQRFYDPLDGAVNAENVDIRKLNIQWLRSQIGIVSQEPLLFDMSISDNIAYGDNSRIVPMDEIITAARNANIHSFIQSLPQGYETNAGDKGGQLSGGQKQRVAIARALLRNPKILLLDEATSALDTQSEQIVQEALDKARMGRTCIVIAHRLSTIQSADKIILIRHGKVEEAGTHYQLLELKGAYYNLHQAQNRPKKTQ